VKSGKRSTAMGTSDRGGLLTAATQRSKWLAIAAGKFRVPEILSAACGHRFDCDGLMRPQACDGNHKPWSRNFQVTNKPGQHRTAVLPIVLEIVPKKSGCRLPSSQAARSLDARPRVSRRQRLRCLAVRQTVVQANRAGHVVVEVRHLDPVRWLRMVPLIWACPTFFSRPHLSPFRRGGGFPTHKSTKINRMGD